MLVGSCEDKWLETGEAIEIVREGARGAAVTVGKRVDPQEAMMETGYGADRLARRRVPQASGLPFAHVVDEPFHAARNEHWIGTQLAADCYAACAPLPAHGHRDEVLILRVFCLSCDDETLDEFECLGVYQFAVFRALRQHEERFAVSTHIGRHILDGFRFLQKTSEERDFFVGHACARCFICRGLYHVGDFAPCL